MERKTGNQIAILLLLINLTFLLTECSKQAVPVTAEVNYKGTKDKTIKVVSVGYGENESEAMNDAGKRAFETLLFRGIPGSPNPKAMIEEPEEKVKKEHGKFFHEFFDDKGYQSFITSSFKVTPGSKDKQTKLFKLALELDINYSSLRTHLEQNEIIHKFGF